MSDTPILYGFDGSTYVRTVKMVLADKAVDYDQVQVNVLEGEPRQPDHLARHPFGKVPVLDIDGLRLRETEAICRYLEETRAGNSLMPKDAKARAKMSEAIGLIDSYGYGALVGAAGYHLFPDLIGGQNDEALAQALSDSDKLMKLLMENKGDSDWLAGDEPSLADYFLGPIMFYVSLTPEAEKVMATPGVKEWWKRISDHDTFKATEPDLGE